MNTLALICNQLNDFPHIWMHRPASAFTTLLAHFKATRRHNHKPSSCRCVGSQWPSLIVWNTKWHRKHPHIVPLTSESVHRSVCMRRTCLFLTTISSPSSVTAGDEERLHHCKLWLLSVYSYFPAATKKFSALWRLWIVFILFFFCQTILSISFATKFPFKALKKTNKKKTATSKCRCWWFGCVLAGVCTCVPAGFSIVVAVAHMGNCKTSRA